MGRSNQRCRTRLVCLVLRESTLLLNRRTERTLTDISTVLVFLAPIHAYYSRRLQLVVCHICGRDSYRDDPLLDLGTLKLPWTCGSGKEDVDVDGVGKPASAEDGDIGPDIYIINAARD
jgi:hypothetical protein